MHLITRVISLVPLVFISSVYAEFPALKEFTPPPEKYNKVNDFFEITNLPTIPPQGGRGICFAVSAALILTAENCRFLKEDCKSYTPEKIFSPYGLVRRWYTDDSKYMNAYDMDGGSVVNSLNSAIYNRDGTPSLECTAKSKTMPGFIDSDDNAKKEMIMWEKLLAIYRKLTKKAQEVDTSCHSCVEEFNTKYNLDFFFVKNIFTVIQDKPKGFVHGLRRDSFREFVETLTVPSICKRAKNEVWIENDRKLEVSVYPPVEGEVLWSKVSEKVGDNKINSIKGNYKDAIGIINKTLRTGRVLALENICISELNVGKSCNEKHTAVISGVKKMCTPKNHCIDVLKIKNTWGDNWQKQVNDGWVQAKPLLDSTKYKGPFLYWLTDKQVTEASN